MSKFDTKAGFGSVMPNRYKISGSRQPDFKGHIKLDQDYPAGTLISFGGWKKATKVGEIITLKISNKQDREEKPDPETGDVPF